MAEWISAPFLRDVVDGVDHLHREALRGLVGEFRVLREHVLHELDPLLIAGRFRLPPDGTFTGSVSERSTVD
jgi:hypothetical protein